MLLKIYLFTIMYNFISSGVVVFLLKKIEVKQTSKICANFGKPSRGVFSALHGTERRTTLKPLGKRK